MATLSEEPHARIQISYHRKRSAPQSGRLFKDAHTLGFQNLQKIDLHDLYFIEGQLSQDDCRKLSLKLLADFVT